MKVKELIEELREYDPKLEVNIEVLKKELTWRIFDIEHVELVELGGEDNEKEVRLIANYWGKKY